MVNSVQSFSAGVIGKLTAFTGGSQQNNPIQKHRALSSGRSSGVVVPALVPVRVVAAPVRVVVVKKTLLAVYKFIFHRLDTDT